MLKNGGRFDFAGSYSSFACLVPTMLAFAMLSCNKAPARPDGFYSASASASASARDGADSDDLSADELISDESASQAEPEEDSESSDAVPEPSTTSLPVTPASNPAVASPTTAATTVAVPATNPVTAECTSKLSVGRIYQWIATAEGQMIPSSGTIVVKEGDKNVARVKFVGNEWHVLPTWLKNTFESEVDLSASKGFILTYSATADLYLQLRPSFAWSGGEKYLVKIPSTSGQSKSLTVDFKEGSWTTLDALGKPTYTLAMAVKQVRGFVFVGNLPNEFAVTGLLIDGFTPPCP